MQTDFHGAKLAILVGDHVVTLLRDDRQDIPFPDHWDLPGGGRDPGETPDDTALRELHEELGLILPPDRIHYRRPYISDGRVWFLVAHWPEFDPRDVVFGDEGQGWKLMAVKTFLSHPRAVPYLQVRLAHFLQQQPKN